MKTLFDLKPGEKIICSDTGVWLRGGLKNQMGQFFLTNQRIVFIRNNLMLSILFGLLGTLVAHWFVKATFDCALKDISGIQLSSFGFNKRVTLLQTMQGDEKFNLTRPYEEWEQVIKKQLSL